MEVAKQLVPSAMQLKEAHRLFLENEPRDLFYRAATELTELALKGKTSLSLSEAIAVLLQTWNRAYYQYYRFDHRHFVHIDQLLNQHAELLIKEFRNRSISSLCENDEAKVEAIFTAFETVLGPTGAAKALHLLAPRFFPLWDGAIAKAYGSTFKLRGRNGAGYWRFMVTTRLQYQRLCASFSQQVNLLKLVDEYNYCRYTKHWL